MGIGSSGYWLARTLLSQEDELARLAIPVAAMWSVSVAHGIFDFNWYIPANMTLVVLSLAIAVRLFRMSDPAEQRSIAIPKPMWMVSAVGVLALSTFCVGHFVGPATAESSWNEYLAWSLASNRFESKSMGPGRQSRLGPVDGNSPKVVAWMIQQLDQAVLSNPSDSRAHIRLSAMCLRQFDLLQAQSENAMSLAEIRDAAIHGGFASQDEMVTWLKKVVGTNYSYLQRAWWHARQGLRGSPLSGRGYIYLSEVAFLDPELGGHEYGLLHQAYLVRPNDPSSQFLFGRQQLLVGNQKAGTALWKEAFRGGTTIRQRIIPTLAPVVTPEELISAFEPDLNGLRDIFDYYRAEATKEETRRVALLYVEELESQAGLMSAETAADLWYDAQFVYSTLGMTDRAVMAARRAIEHQPTEYRNHFACALRLREAGRIEEAVYELRWCQARRPDDATLQQALINMSGQLRSVERTPSSILR